MASNEEQPNVHLTLDELLSAAERSRSEVKASDASSRATSPATKGRGQQSLVARLKLAEVPVNTPQPKKMDQTEVKNLLFPLREIVQPIGALPRDKLDPRAVSKKQKQLANFSTNEMTFANYRKDGEFINVCRQVGLHKFDEHDAEAFVQAFEASMEYVGSSGSLQGVLTRLVKGLSEAPIPRFDVDQAVEWANSVVKYHPIEYDFVGKSADDVIRDCRRDKAIVMNKNSSAGVPYYRKLSDPTVVGAALELANVIVNSISAGSFEKDVASARPSLFAVQLKNKSDRYARARLSDKIRPYFIYPFHERLLYSLMQCRLKAVRFDEDPTMPHGSAVGFSWAHGGGDRLYDWIRSRKGMGVGIYCIFYGDDQLWVCVLGDGDVYVIVPDYSHMDLSLSSRFGRVAKAVWRPAFKHLDRTWAAVLTLNTKRAFDRPVIVDGALTYRFMHGLASGVPGTTKFDEVASAAVIGFIAEEYSKRPPVNLAELMLFLGYVKDAVKSKFGLIFKDGTLHPFKFVEDQPEYSFVFLGMTLVRYGAVSRWHYLPKPSLSRLLVSATTLTKSFRDHTTASNTACARIRSLYASGGFHYGTFAEVASAYFGALTKKGYSPNGVDDDDMVEAEESRFMPIDFTYIGKDWPTPEWCANLYLPPDDQVPEVSGYALSERAASDTLLQESTYRLTLSDEDEEFEEAVETALAPSTDWATQMDRERPPTDIGDANMPVPPRVSPKHQAELQPLPDVVKRAWEEEQKRKREAVRAQRVTGPVRKKKIKGKRLGKVTYNGETFDDDLYEDPESDYDPDDIMYPQDAYADVDEREYDRAFDDKFYR